MSADLIAERDALRLTVEVEQAKLAFRDKVIARLEARVTALEKALEPALPFLDRLSGALIRKNSGMFVDAWTDDGVDLGKIVKKLRAALSPKLGEERR